MVQLICPNLNCRKILTVRESERGTVLTCRHCLRQYRVPEKKVLLMDLRQPQHNGRGSPVQISL